MLENYLYDLQVRGFAETTLRVRRIYLAKLLRWFRQNKISNSQEVTEASLRHYQRFLFDYKKKNGHPLAIASQYSRLAGLKDWFKWIASRGYIAQNPAEHLELPHVGYKLPTYLNQEQAELVMGNPPLHKPGNQRPRLA